jgi:hypothetical protein
MVEGNKCVICGKELPMDMTQLILNMGDGHFESCCCSHEGSQAVNDYYKLHEYVNNMSCEENKLNDLKTILNKMDNFTNNLNSYCETLKQFNDSCKRFIEKY